MKKNLIVIALVLLVVVANSSCGKVPDVPLPENPLKKERTVIAVNATNQTIKKITLYTEDGRKVGRVKKAFTPGDEYTFTITKKFKKDNTFRVEMIDRDNSEYNVKNVKVGDDEERVVSVSDSNLTKKGKKGIFDIF